MHKITILNKEDRTTIEGRSRRDLYTKVVQYLLSLFKNADTIIRDTVKVYNEPKFYKNTRDTNEIKKDFHLYVNYSILDINKNISKLAKTFNLNILDDEIEDLNCCNNSVSVSEENIDYDIGCVYLLENKYMPGVYKIGVSSTQKLNSRLQSLYNTSVPVEFSVLYKVETEDSYAVEQALHDIMEDKRINPKREFFKLSDSELKMVKKIMDHLTC